MFERRSWERTFLLKPKTPQTKELVPEIKEAWWSKQETILQLPVLPKWTPLLSVELAVTQTGQASVPHLGKERHAWKLFRKVFKLLSPMTCHAYYRTNHAWTVFPGLLFFSRSGISTHADIVFFSRRTEEYPSLQATSGHIIYMCRSRPNTI